MYPLVILAGGLATRLRPVTETIPKSLVEIYDEPFVFHQLRLLRSKGITEIIFCTGYLGQMIEEVVGDGSLFGMQVRYVNDGDELLGTGGAIKKILPLLADSFFITYGDSYLDCDYSRLQAIYDTESYPAVMSIFKNGDLWDKSNVEYDEAANELICYSKSNKTSSMNYIDYGLTLVNKSIFDDFSIDKVFDLATVFEKLTQQKKLGAYVAPLRFYEVGSFTGIEEFNQYLKIKHTI